MLLPALLSFVLVIGLLAVIWWLVAAFRQPERGNEARIQRMSKDVHPERRVSKTDRRHNHSHDAVRV